MKLLRCHIDNFGTFHNYDMEFSDGLNVIMQENGWGKSTLTAFLKAMLYGFDSRRTRDITENERRRYIPWQGGKYSGTLDFKVNGKQYRVQRTFGEVPRNDRCRVTELATGLPCPQAGDCVGEWLFHLDSAAFQRSVYIASVVPDASNAKSGLHTRLNALVSEANDVGKYDAAVAMLDQRRRFYEKTGNRGEIAEITNQIAVYQQEKRNYESMIREIAQIRSYMSELSGQLQAVEEKIKVARKEMEEAEAENQSAQAALKVYADMQQQMKALEEKLSVLINHAGRSIPDMGTLAEMEKLLDAFEQLNERVQSNTKELTAVQASVSEMRNRYNGIIPEAKAIQGIRADVSKLQSLRENLDAHKNTSAALTGMNARIHTYSQTHPQYIEECDEILTDWPTINLLREKMQALEMQIPYEEKLWQERKAQYAALTETVDSAEQAVNHLCSRKKMPYAEAHKRLSEYSEAYARIEREEKRLLDDPDRAEREELELLFKNNVPESGEIERLTSDIDSVAQMNREASEMEASLHAEELKRQKACEAFDTLKNSHVESAAQETGESKGKMLTGICLIVIALLAAAAGILKKDLALVFFAVAAACAVGGAIMIVLHGKEKKEHLLRQRQIAETHAMHENELAKAEAACNAQRSICQEISGRLMSQKDRLHQCQRHTNEYLRRWFPDLLIGEEQRYLAILLRQLARWNDLNTAHDHKLRAAETIAESKRAADSSVEAVYEAYPEIHSMPLSDAIAKLSRMQAESDIAERRLAEGRKELLKFLMDSAKVLSLEAESNIVCNEMELSRVKTVVGDEKTLLCAAKAINALNASISEGLHRIKNEMAGAMDLLQRYLVRLKKCLRPLDLLIETVNDMPSGIDQLDRLLRGYKAYLNAVREKDEHSEMLRAEVISTEAALEKRFGECGMRYDPERVVALLNRAEEDSQSAEKLKWTEQRIGKDLQRDSAVLGDMEKQIEAQLLPFAASEDERPRAILHRLQECAENNARLLNEQSALRQQMEKFAAEHAIDVPMQSGPKSNFSANPDQQRMLAVLQQSRDALLQENAQCKERIRQINVALERYPNVEQGLKLLYAKRREATENLFAIQQSARLLKEAKESLAGQYLGHIEGYFNAYLEMWLGSDAVSGSIDSDFHVTLHENNVGHSAEGYSTGYCDIIDLSMRMALIRTLFEEEKPFVIMDDPFVNLDQSRLSNALGFIRNFAEEYQVIYFTCHPVRAYNAELLQVEIPAAKLAVKALPVRKKVMPSAERKQAEKAAYHIVPGKKGIIPSGLQRKITNNIFSLRFDQEDTNDLSEKQYEVFFVDEKDRILSDRQIIEVSFGQLTPAAVRFCLNTREDSGRYYSLVIRDSTQPEGDVLKKIPYEAAISFAVDFEF